MTICIGKPGYMSDRQIKQLADEGHEVGLHTLDHPDMRKLSGTKPGTQIIKPKRKLEAITAKKVEYFAYPYGAWNNAAVIALKQSGIKAAFQLSDKESERESLYTLRRLLVPGNWTATTLHKQIQATFR